MSDKVKVKVDLSKNNVIVPKEVVKPKLAVTDENFKLNVLLSLMQSKRAELLVRA